VAGQTGATGSATSGTAGGRPGGRRRALWLWLAASGCAVLTLLWLLVAGACLLFWLRGPARYQCYEIVIADPTIAAEDMDRLATGLLTGADRATLYRSVAENGKLTVYSRSAQVADALQRALPRDARVEAVRRLAELPPAPAPASRAELRVVFDHDRCKALGTSADEIRRQLGSRLDKAGPEDLQAVSNLEIGTFNGSPRRLTDVAMVQYVNVSSRLVRNYPQDAPGPSPGGAGER
jgi:hypothetical protein